MMDSIKREPSNHAAEDATMTKIYDFINRAIDRAKGEPDLVPVLDDAFRFCTYRLRYTDRQPKKVMSLDDWSEFFEHLKNMDQANRSTAMTKRSLKLLNQLETMLTERVVFKRRLRLLLKRSAARKWFDDHFQHVSHGAWELKDWSKNP